MAVLFTVFFGRRSWYCCYHSFELSISSLTSLTLLHVTEIKFDSDEWTHHFYFYISVFLTHSSRCAHIEWIKCLCGFICVKGKKTHSECGTISTTIIIIIIFKLTWNMQMRNDIEHANVVNGCRSGEKAQSNWSIWMLWLESKCVLVKFGGNVSNSENWTMLNFIESSFISFSFPFQLFRQSFNGVTGTKANWTLSGNSGKWREKERKKSSTERTNQRFDGTIALNL